ncbi:MAG TPA: hypothetical protein VLI05_03815 [Candidatus Saccharimonadia bacterium]|nr:hypothetical protein [Candidatus Saccharimonadia bacterium]
MTEQAIAHQISEAHNIGWFTLEEFNKLATLEDVRSVLRQELAK